jgi:hypothetical protein
MKRTFVLVAAAALVVAACSSGLDSATKEYCDDLATLQTSIEKVQDLSVDSTVDDVADIRDGIADAYIAVAESAVNLDDAFTEEIVTAQQEFDAAIEAIPGDASLGDAVDDLKAAQTDYVTSLKNTMSKLSCDS